VYSFIIVSFNSCAVTLKAIASIKVSAAQANTSCEIMVVDNNSVDGTVEAVQTQHSDVTCIANANNLGFAAANNIGAKAATGD
jgi:GT2 family glycosyltransferase